MSTGLVRVAKRLSRRLLLSAGLVLPLLTVAAAQARAVEIEYWQYVFDSRIKAMNELIKRFEAANPDIKVKQTTFPYADYQTKVTASLSAGIGPDVVQLYYGWLPNFIDAKLIRPMPQDAFPPATVDKDFYPFVQVMKTDGVYYGLPTAVRSMALFYNKKLFAAAGLDPAKPPATLDELVQAAEKLAKRDGAGNLLVEGIALDIARQDHAWWREALVRNFGGEPYTDHDRKVAYDSPAGVASLNYYVDLQRKYKVGQEGFMDEGQAAFRAGRAAMVIDGSFRLGTFAAIKSFEWGVGDLPAGPDGKANFASFWVNSITSKSSGEKLAAATKFMAYLTSPEAMEIWLRMAGELPARPAVAETEKNLADPLYGPFIRGLRNAHTPIFADEAAQRQIHLDMMNRVLIQGQDTKASLDEAARAEQALLDRAYAKH